VTATTVHGDTRSLARLVTGDCVGEMSLLTGSPASATVTALADSELWALGHADFLELLATCPTLARNMAVILSRRLSLAAHSPEPGMLRWMRLRAHPDVAPEFPEAIARAVARHASVLLLVLDDRRNHRWRPEEQLPSLR